MTVNIILTERTMVWKPNKLEFLHCLLSMEVETKSFIFKYLRHTTSQNSYVSMEARDAQTKKLSQK